MPEIPAGFKHRLYAVLNAPLEGPRTAGRFINAFLFFLIIGNIFAVILESVQPLEARYGSVFNWFELISTLIFTLEYVMRLWTANLHPEFKEKFGRLKYIASPLAILDLLAISPFYLPWVLPFDLRFLRVLRLFRMVGLLKIVRYAKSIRMISDVFKDKKDELLVAFALLLAILLISSTLVFYAEQGAQPDKFTDIPTALWWGIVTLTTVGYGDVFPVTPLGKFLAGIIAVLGIGLFALPAGLLSAGIVEQVQKGKKKTKCPHCGKEI